MNSQEGARSSTPAPLPVRQLGPLECLGVRGAGGSEPPPLTRRGRHPTHSTHIMERSRPLEWAHERAPSLSFARRPSNNRKEVL